MKYVMALLFGMIIFLLPISATSQVRWSVGGNMGISIGTGGGFSDAGFHFGPMAEVLIGKGPAAGTEFNINTQTGTPIEWANYFKYYFSIPGSKVKPYADAGVGLFFYTGGPYFDIRFGGGAQFEIARNLFIPADVQLGPVFVLGSTGFLIYIRSGLRYEI